ncbi:MAG: hypothetical protein LCH79_16255 [Proteobacteria bacterium]|nr:hypothetical protein [Pseudomonadota bacterium]
MGKPRKKPATITMVVTVPRLPELTAAQHRASVKDAIKHTGDFYGRAVRVSPVLAPTKPVNTTQRVRSARDKGTKASPELARALAALLPSGKAE